MPARGGAAAGGPRLRERRTRRLSPRRTDGTPAFRDAGGRYPPTVRRRGRSGSGHARRPGRLPRAGRSTARLFPDRRRTCARQRVQGHRVQSAALRQRGGVAAPPPGGVGDRACRQGDAAGVPAGFERPAGARRLADLRGRAAAASAEPGRAGAARFLRRPRARGQAAQGDGRVRAEPVPPGSALPSRARRRVPGHEPGSVGARRAAGAKLGRRAGRGGGRDCPVHLHRGRPEAVDLRLSRRRRRRARRGGRLRARPPSGGRPEARDLGQLPVGAAAARFCKRRVRRNGRAGGAAEGCFPLWRLGPVPRVA